MSCTVLSRAPQRAPRLIEHYAAVAADAQIRARGESWLQPLNTLVGSL